MTEMGAIKVLKSRPRLSDRKLFDGAAVHLAEKESEEAVMSEQVDYEHERIELTPVEARQGFKGADILAVLAVSTFLAAIGLTTFFLTTSLS